MKGIAINFKNRPNEDGTLSSFAIDDCLIASNGSPSARRPQVIVHLPKASSESIVDAWFEYDGNTYHVIGTTPRGIAENTPTRWDRFCIAEKIY